MVERLGKNLKVRELKVPVISTKTQKGVAITTKCNANKELNEDAIKENANLKELQVKVAQKKQLKMLLCNIDKESGEEEAVSAIITENCLTDEDVQVLFKMESPHRTHLMLEITKNRINYISGV